MRRLPLTARSSRAIATLGLLLLGSCGDESPAAAPPPEPALVTVRPAEQRTITQWDEYLGRLEAVDSVDVRSRVSGYLSAVHFEDGALVEEGQILFTIDPRPFEASLERARGALAEAEASLSLSRNDYERAAEVAQSANAISAEELDSRKQAVDVADARVQAARASVTSAELELEYTSITAPMAGRIGRRLESVGDLVQADGTSLTTIVSLDPIYCYFSADEQAYLRYSRLSRSGERPSSREVANPVAVALADEDEFVHEGVMDFVDNAFDESTGTIRGRAVLENGDGLLTPGLFARLRLLGRSEFDALLVPEVALSANQSERFVFVVNDADEIEYRALELGNAIDGMRIVNAGIEPGERVVVRGQQRLREGDRVRVQLERDAESSETDR